MEEKKEKMSREQLEKLVNDQYRELVGLKEALGRAQSGLMFRRLDYLFKVLEMKGCFDEGFVAGCADEIEHAIIIPKGDDEKEEE